MIIQSLSCLLASFALIQLTSVLLVKNTVMLDLLITFIYDEWDCGQLFRKDTSQSEEEDILFVEINKRPKGKVRKNKKRKWKPKKRRSCWEYSSIDHWKKDKRGNGDNPPRKLGISANIIKKDDCSFIVKDDEELAIKEVSSIMKPSLTRVKVFDSGATTHIPLYQSNFTTFEPILPKVLYTINKQGFCTIGKGEMVLDLPNDNTTSKLYLSEVLYSPEASYTLVSIGRLNNKGFSAICSNRQYIIRDESGT